MLRVESSVRSLSLFFTTFPAIIEGMPCRLCLLLCCCLIFGCGSPRTYDVRIVVTLDGEPLEGATVVLLPVRENDASMTGITDMNGEVTFNTDDNTDENTDDNADTADTNVGGIVAGSYIVTVSKTVEERRLTNNEIRALAEAGIRYNPDIVELVPLRYTRRDTSDLRMRIGYWRSNVLTLDLLSEPFAP